MDESRGGDVSAYRTKVIGFAAALYDKIRSKETRKAINFDLETAAVLRETGQKSTAPAYSAIRAYMESHGFKHRQYSGYISIKPMNMRQVRQVIIGLEQALPWITKCYERCDATAVLGASFDLLKMRDYESSDWSVVPKTEDAAKENGADHEAAIDIDPADLTPEEQSLTLDAIAELYLSCCDAFGRPNDGRCPGTDRSGAR